MTYSDNWNSHSYTQLGKEALETTQNCGYYQGFC